MSDPDRHPDDPNKDDIRGRLPDEVFAAEADFVKLSFKQMTAKRMVGWLRGYAEYCVAAGHTKTADDAWGVANRLANELPDEEVKEREFGESDDGDEVAGNE